jgi:hypothetical protein
MNIDKAINKLTERSRQVFTSITMVVGGNDCSPDSSIDELSKKLKKGIQLAKALVKTGDIRVSSVLPRLDNTKAQARIEEFNSALVQICKETKAGFIDNLSFRLGNAEINDGFLSGDGMEDRRQQESQAKAQLKN